MYVQFVRDHTVIKPPSLVPELQVHLATELTPLWTATEAFLRERDIAPPYWAFPWPGSQALARWVLDHPERVRGRRVLDFAAGGGLAAIAAASVGATAIGVEIDPVAGDAMRVNAALNGVEIEVWIRDVCEEPAPAVDLVMAGDVCYSRPMVARILPWFRRCVAAGVEVVLADPGRAFVPADQVEVLGEYTVPTSRELEDRDERVTRLIRLLS